jgi:hypothetical protein
MAEARLAKRIYRRLYWLPKDLAWKRRLKGIDELLYFGDRGLGDDLLCTAVLHELHKRGRTKVAMMSNWPELFENLPYPAKVIPYDYGALHCIERAGVKLRQPSYVKAVTTAPLRYEFQSGHFIESMCRSVGIEGDIDLRPHVALTEQECSRWADCRGAVVVQTSRANPRFELRNKEWLPEYWEKLPHWLGGLAPLVQVGGAEDPPFAGARDLRGRTSLRDAMAIVSNARLFLGLEGFLMHLAAAVGTRSVIIYGGYLHPSQSGYPGNTNLFTELPCSPCGFASHCDFDRECMRKITPEMVAEAVREALRAGNKEISGAGLEARGG